MTTKIEEVYQILSRKSNPLYFDTYALVKSRLDKSYFPFLRDVQPFRTDHGIEHINRILEKLSHFLRPHLPVPGNTEGRIIDLENLNLLLNATLWHDLGNLYGRSDHAQNIAKIFGGVSTFLYDPPHSELILKIAQGHCGENSIERVIEDESTVIYDSVIYAQFLSALLRISDEIDEDQRRVETRLISKVPKECEAYWRFCSCNESIMPIYQGDSLGNVSLEIKVMCKMPKEAVYAKWGKNSNEVICISEYVSRLSKMNKERMYCNKFLRQYSALYFRNIDRINAEIHVYDEKGSTADKIAFSFNDSSTETDFFGDKTIMKILKKYQ